MSPVLYQSSKHSQTATCTNVRFEGLQTQLREIERLTYSNYERWKGLILFPLMAIDAVKNKPCYSCIGQVVTEPWSRCYINTIYRVTISHHHHLDHPDHHEIVNQTGCLLDFRISHWTDAQTVNDWTSRIGSDWTPS